MRLQTSQHVDGVDMKSKHSVKCPSEEHCCEANPEAVKGAADEMTPLMDGPDVWCPYTNRCLRMFLQPLMDSCLQGWEDKSKKKFIIGIIVNILT